MTTGAAASGVTLAAEIVCGAIEVGDEAATTELSSETLEDGDVAGPPSEVPQDTQGYTF